MFLSLELELKADITLCNEFTLREHQSSQPQYGTVKKCLTYFDKCSTFYLKITVNLSY